MVAIAVGATWMLNTTPLGASNHEEVLNSYDTRSVRQLTCPLGLQT